MIPGAQHSAAMISCTPSRGSPPVASLRSSKPQLAAARGPGRTTRSPHWLPRSGASVLQPAPHVARAAPEGAAAGWRQGGDAAAAAAAPVAAAGGAAAADAAAPPVDLSLEPFKALVEGRRFMCTMCGKCCTGEGEIWVSFEEAGRIAKHLNVPERRFFDIYCKQYSRYKGWRMLKTQGDSSACVFLGADNKCAIHTVRPSQCSTYPWWPELTEDAEWEYEKANVCEGFDHPEAGPLDVESAARQLREANKMTELQLLASTAKGKDKANEMALALLVIPSSAAGQKEQP